MKTCEDEIKLEKFKEAIEQIKEICNHQVNCKNCPFRHDSGRCKIMLLTTAEDAPCDW